jgi:hypothetical protein
MDWILHEGERVGRAIAYGPADMMPEYYNIFLIEHRRVSMCGFETDEVTANTLLEQSRAAGTPAKYNFRPQYLTDYLGNNDD